MHKDQKLLDKKTLDSVLIDCLFTRLGLGIMTAREETFAKGLISFYKGRESLTEAQANSARKLVVRLVCERDQAYLNDKKI